LYVYEMKFNLKLLFLFAFVLTGHLAACEAPPQPPIRESRARPVLSGTAHVYDGDSIFFGSVEVRLDAIDAPERDQACKDAADKFWPCGIAARDVLRRMAGASEVECLIKGRDKYRRLLGICYAHSHDLNAAMVEAGYAIAYHYFSEKYAREESRAKARHAGIWQDAGFTEPYFCRHFTAGHTCYEYDYASGTGRVARLPLIGKSHAAGAPD
jgi:endonuclease YncB( thermonuclease family)